MRTRSAIAGLFLSCAVASLGQENLVRVNLEETGIASPRFQNPKSPVALGLTGGLDFYNATSNRTFVVTIPFEMREDEAKSKYSVARVQRSDRTVAYYTCETLKLTAGSDCTPEQKLQLERLEKLQLFRELAAGGTFADNDTLSELNEVKPGNKLDMSHIEALYWTAACRANEDERAKLGVGDDAPPHLADELALQATALVERYHGAPNTRGCGKNEAIGIRDNVLKKFKSTEGAAAKATFAVSRKKLVLTALKLATEREIRKQYEQRELVDVLEKLDAERIRLQDLQNDKGVSTRAQARCFLHLVRTAATLTASYGPDASAPLMSPFTADDPAVACGPNAA